MATRARSKRQETDGTERTVRASISFPELQYQCLEKIAEENKVSLAWVVREATTNIIRHSNATAVKIDLEVSAPATSGSIAVLRIENDGTPGRTSSTDGGTGLVGLRERLATLGGLVTAEAGSDGHFVVQAKLPLETDPPPATTQPELAT